MVNQFNYVLALPEIILCVMAMAILLLEAFFKSKESLLSYGLTILTYVVVAAVVIVQWSTDTQGTTFYGHYSAEPLSYLFKVFAALAMLLCTIYGRRYVQDRNICRDGYLYALSLFCFLGQLVMISSTSMLTMFIGLELMSLALYALIALDRDSLGSIESAMKYFVLGSLASGIMLYGMSLVYGATGHIDFAGILSQVQADQYDTYILILGTVFMVCGVGYKLGAVPFHMWVPDVYQGAPTAVTGIIGSAPKIAALAMAIRILVESLPDIAMSWQPMLAIMAVLSLIIGNFSAIMQTNFKRMLGYSTISHVGFVLLGLLSGIGADNEISNDAYASAVFYLVTYVITTLPAFGLVMVLARKNFESCEIADLRGLNRRNPMLAFVVLILMFSYAGLPPMVGFYAKLTILQSVIHAGYIWIAIVAVLCSLVGCFYYLRVVKAVYFDEPVDHATETVPFNFTNGLISINGLAVLVLGILPGGLMALCTSAVMQTLHITL